MKMIVGIILFLGCVFANADGEEDTIQTQDLKIESRTTEPTELPDPIDQPPVLQYAKPMAPVSQRAPANASIQKYIDADLGVACYYVMPQILPGVAASGAPSISCVRLEQKNPTVAPRQGPPSQPSEVR